jgi:hypothetical protein
MTSILAIDPGPRFSAYVELAGVRILARGKVGNLELLKLVREREPHGPLVVEMVAPYGRVVGRHVFNTCVWVGRYLEAWRGVGRLLTRQEVKKALGMRMQSTDADVRAMRIERWGGKVSRRPRDVPEPLRGVTGDQWAALAVAVAWKTLHGEAFEAVEAAQIGGLEELNRALGLQPDASKQELHTAGRDPVCQVNYEVSGSDRFGEISRGGRP